MQTRAAVACLAGQPLTIETVDLEGRKFGEALVEIKATGICYTDYYTLSRADPEGLFPAILGHEGIALAKIRPDAPFDKVCYIGCGVTTGVGAVLFRSPEIKEACHGIEKL